MNDHPDKHYMPHESPEASEWDQWREQALKGELKTVRSIAAWTDVCGFGELLKDALWDLGAARKSGLFEVLSHTYSLLGKPFIIGIPPMPTERILVINDGVARTADLSSEKYTNRMQMVLFIRELLMHHFMLQRQLILMGLGLRTVVAGGERCQYSPQKTTGESHLYYTNKPSELGKQILSQRFLYNPAEFQMNTAFAIAYTLDGLGTSAGLHPNRLYIDSSWIDAINQVAPNLLRVNTDSIDVSESTACLLSIGFDRRLSVPVRGKICEVLRVSKMVVHKAFDGEETEFPMDQDDRRKNA